MVTAIADPYVSIGWAATAVPFLSPYRTMAIGLGTLAVDLGAAVLLTSVLRHRLGLRAWRAVHWLAYLAWPAAFAHALSAGGDLRTGWVAAVVWGSAAAVAAAVAARLARPAAMRTDSGCTAWPVDASAGDLPAPHRRPAAPAPAAAGRGTGGTDPASLRAHLARHGARPVLRGRLAAQAASSSTRWTRANLTGRGGAGLPDRAQAARARQRRTSPGRHRQRRGRRAGQRTRTRSCSRPRPHLVVDGAVCAAELTGASEVVIVAHRAACRPVRQAAAERRRAGRDPVPVRVRAAAGGLHRG